MPFVETDSERAIILLRKRDAEIAAKLFAEACIPAKICSHRTEFIAELNRGAGFCVLSQEMDSGGSGIYEWVRTQPSWSDLPIIMLTGHIDDPGRNRLAATLQERFGNVSFLERPFHPTTLVSQARTALRSRRRQYEARAMLGRYELLARELQHRTKNLLSVILSIASASLREDGDGSEALIARLHSLAKAQDLIFEEGGSGALLEHVVRKIVDSFGVRVSVEGPEVFLQAGVAQGFALIVHELATNAAKYGALTVSTGRVSVRWHVITAVAGNTVSFTWQESNGPLTAPPKHRGFGTILLERAVTSFGKPPRFDYAPDGFTYQIIALCR